MDESRKRKISERLKGQHHSIKTEFKKDHVPWSKGKIGKEYPTYKNGTGSFRKEIKLNKKDIEHCQNCKKKLEKINIHHIDKNRLNNNMENLMILCTSCHNAIHDNGRKTRFQKGYIPHNKGKKFVGGHYFGRPI